MVASHSADPFPRILIQTLVAFRWLILLAIVIQLSRLPWVKGYLGELQVRVLAALMLDSKIYHRVNNVTLKTPDGTTQIDHVVVSRFGIFAIETKNMGGWIFGREAQAQWTQKRFRRTFRFQNPLRQNFKHVMALETTLNVAPSTVHSVVVFVGRSTFKTEMPPNVTQGTGLIRFIKSFNQVVFTVAQVDALVQSLQENRLSRSISTHRQHVESLKERSDPQAERLCPKCGAQMVLRAAKTGREPGKQFWGCSEYPRCRFTQSAK